MKNTITEFREKLSALSRGFLEKPDTEFNDIQKKGASENEIKNSFQTLMNNFDTSSESVILEKEKAVRESQIEFKNASQHAKVGLEYSKYEQLKVAHNHKVDHLQPQIDKKQMKQNKDKTYAQELHFDIWKTVELHTPPFIDISTVFYFLLICFISFGEVSVLRSAFEVIRENNLNTLSLGLVSAGAVAIFAHLAGYYIHNFIEDTRKHSSLIIFGVILAIMLAFSYIIGYFRYLTAIDDGVENVSIIMMSAITFVFFAASTLLTLYYHSHVKGTKQQRGAYKKAWKIYNRTRKAKHKLEKKMKIAQNAYLDKLNDLQKNLQTALNKSEKFNQDVTQNDVNTAIEAKLKYDNAQIDLDNTVTLYESFYQTINTTYKETLDMIREKFERTTNENVPRTSITSLSSRLSKSLSIFIMFFSLFLIGCGGSSKPEKEVQREYETLIFYDLSCDTHDLNGYVEGEDIVENMNIDPEDESTFENYGSVRIIGVNDLNNVASEPAKLDPPNENKWERKTKDIEDKIDEFIEEVDHDLSKIVNSKTGSEGTSIYKPFCTYVAKMSKDSEKTIVIISDLMESVAVSFYNENYNLLSKDPDKIIEKLAKEQKIPREIKGARVYLLFNGSKDTNKKHDSQFTVASALWKKMLEDAGAKHVEIGSSFDI